MGKGIWLGTAREANEILIGTKEGVSRCYAIKRMTEEDRWNAEEVAAMRGTPQQPNPLKMGLHIPTRLPMDAALGGGTDGDAVEGGGDAGIPEDEVLISEPLVRRTPITQKEIDKYGMTPGCEGCEAKSRGEVTRRGHSERCRNRIEEAMKNDDSDKKKLDKAAERMTHKIAKDIENKDRKRKVDTGVGGTDGATDTGVERISDTGAQGSQEEPEREVNKRVRFNDEELQESIDVEIADSTEARDGSTDGAAVQSQKRKRDIDDEGGKGMDIDVVTEVSSSSGGAHGAAAGEAEKAWAGCSTGSAE